MCAYKFHTILVKDKILQDDLFFKQYVIYAFCPVTIDFLLDSASK